MSTLPNHLLRACPTRNSSAPAATRRKNPATGAGCPQASEKCPTFSYNLEMIDLDAPIVPGKSAAGVLVGSLINEVLAGAHPHSTTKLVSGEKHDLGTVKVWAKDGVVIQVGVFSGYRGMLQPGIRIGSTISEVQDSFGCSVQEDEEDTLVVATSPGWCFETEEWRNPRTVDNNRDARIVSIFVFASRQ